MTTTTNAKKNLKPGTTVVSKTDAEAGKVVRVATYRRNGIAAWSYLVKTAYGFETWDASDIFAPAAE